MIADHRPDVLTARLKELVTFDESVDTLLAAARAGDPQIAQLTRHALRDVRHYVCPIGRQIGAAWVFVFADKLETPNRFRAHWSLQGASRKKWEARMRRAVLQALHVASWEFLVSLGRLPRCQEPMRMTVVRLVKSSREFVRDDDNLAYSRKHLQDCLKPLGLVKDDRREWLKASVVQDVSPHDTYFTVCFLWPAAADRF